MVNSLFFRGESQQTFSAIRTWARNGPRSESVWDGPRESASYQPINFAGFSGRRVATTQTRPHLDSGPFLLLGGSFVFYFFFGSFHAVPKID